MGDALAEILDPAECLKLLALVPVGRVAVIVDDRPIVLPVNHRVVVDGDGGDEAWVLFRTSEGTVLDTATGNAAFEVDGIDDYHRRGWSVLAQGRLHHLSAPEAAALVERVRPEPWLAGPVDHWLALEIDEISGRRLVDAHETWVFHVRGYL